MRKARIRSATGFYHVVVRGVDRQDIFHDDSDRRMFMALMERFGRKYGMRFHAYVLMDNHVHLLVEDGTGKVSRFMQVLCSVYARWFNRRYDRIGHLFQDRFLSEAVENEGYLLTCCRYILRNPEKAGICRAAEYGWSSYGEYGKGAGLVDADAVTGRFSSIGSFYGFIDGNGEDAECLEIELRPSERRRRLTDRIKEMLGTDAPLASLGLAREELLERLGRLRRAGISIANIARITGVGRYLVQQA